MPCISCEELQSSSYNSYIKAKLVRFFEAHPCILCGETDIRLLDVDDRSVWAAIEQQLPWKAIGTRLDPSKVMCVSCARIRDVENGIMWGIG